MALPSVTGANYPTPDEIRDTFLRAIRYGLKRRGITANTLPGSEYFIRAEAWAGVVSIAIENNRLALADYSPLTATGDNLTELAGVFGVTRRSASTSSGNVTIKTNGSVTIPKGHEATAPNGLKYETTIERIGVSTGDTIAMVSKSTGKATELKSGTVLSWDSASVGNLKPTATVDAGGIDGGADADDDETLRRRLLDRLSAPGAGGNAADVKLDAENASSSVEAAYVYPGVRGPASYDVAITKSGGDRTLSSTVSDEVKTAIKAEFPGFVSYNVTSVEKQEVDVVLAARLPLPKSAGGGGGGWKDATPWPASNAKITALSSGTTYTVENATTAPAAGRRVAVWNPSADPPAFERFTIVSASLVSGTTYSVDLGAAPSAGVGAYISADAENLDAYAGAFRDAVLKVGPGEKTESAQILPRGARYPSTDLVPNSLTVEQLSAARGGHSEVLDLQYGATYATGTSTTLSEPGVPPTTADAPKILVLKHLAIRKL